MNIKPIFLAITLLVLCSCTNLSKLEEMSLDSTDEFNQALAQEYLDFAKSEAAQNDWYDSEYFAKKGIQAAMGRAVWPEQMQDWGIKQEHQEELQWARARLIAILDRETKLSYPQQTAKTQFLFDCWLEQQEEGWQSDDINKCRVEFLLEVAELEQKLGNAVAAPAPVSESPEVEVTDTPEKPTLVYQDYVLNFNFESTEIDGQGAAILDTVVETLNNMKQYVVRLGGHTDRAGEENFNLQLSKNRAEAVAKKLEARGITIAPEHIEAFGESVPIVKTEDGVANKRNRRVEINIQGNQ